MASLSHSPTFPRHGHDLYMQPSNSNMQDLYSFIHTLHPQLSPSSMVNVHDKKPHMNMYSGSPLTLPRLNRTRSSCSSSSAVAGDVDDQTLADKISVRRLTKRMSPASKGTNIAESHIASHAFLGAASPADDATVYKMKRSRTIPGPAMKGGDVGDILVMDNIRGIKRTKSEDSALTSALNDVEDAAILLAQKQPTTSGSGTRSGTISSCLDSPCAKILSKSSKKRASSANPISPAGPRTDGRPISSSKPGVPVTKSKRDGAADNAAASNIKPDVIHVRARRGQATDSHSLAERVRREKISERMKYLQDLVPGCVKVTGKAMMLEEIINYVQSLQKQVEFLSMKLAAVPPSQLEFDLANLFGKKVAQSTAKDGQPDNVKDESTALLASTDHHVNVGLCYPNSQMDLANSQRDDFCQAPLAEEDRDLPYNSSDYVAHLQSELASIDMPNVTSGSIAHLSGTVQDPMQLPTPEESGLLHNVAQPDQLEWDEELQSVTQQMGFFSQNSRLFNAPQLLLNNIEGPFFQGEF